MQSLLSLSLSLGDALAADAASFDPRSVAVTPQSPGGSVPVGTIMAWPVAKNPDDWDKWLECNGQSISQSTYPELYAVVGSQVPDYRGLFLRDVGGNSAALGTQQGDAIRNIYGKAGMLYGEQGSDGAFYDGNSALVFYITGNGWRIRMFDASRIVPTASENRPVNKAVRYLIRARP